jgi:hypothetical protein
MFVWLCFAYVIHCFVAAGFAMSSGRGGNRSNTGNSSHQDFIETVMLLRTV